MQMMNKLHEDICFTVFLLFYCTQIYSLHVWLQHIFNNKLLLPLLLLLITLTIINVVMIIFNNIMSYVALCRLWLLNAHKFEEQVQSR